MYDLRDFNDPTLGKINDKVSGKNNGYDDTRVNNPSFRNSSCSLKASTFAFIASFFE